MANSTPSRPGANQLGSNPLELNLDLFGGEVIAAFESHTKLRDKHITKSLSKGRSFKFPAVWKADAFYHTPGVEILGRQIASTDITVDPDDKLVADAFIADIDEILNHWDHRSQYLTALGQALAERFDRNIARTLLLASRAGALFSGDQGGSAIVDAALTTDANKLIDAFSMAKQTMDEKDVPVESQPVFGLLKPAQWYLVARSDKNLNKDFNGVATIQRMSLTTIDEIQILKSNLTPFGEDSRAGNYANVAHKDFVPAPYRGSFGTTCGVVWTPYAAASAMVQDVGFNIVEQPEKQGTLLLSRMMVGTRKLRSKCAVELRTGAIPA